MGQWAKKPDKEVFSSLYKIHSQRELCELIGCTKKTLRRWILEFGLSLRNKGGGNNRKYKNT